MGPGTELGLDKARPGKGFDKDGWTLCELPFQSRVGKVDVVGGPRLPWGQETPKPRQAPALGWASHRDAAPGDRGHGDSSPDCGWLWSQSPRPPDGFEVWHGGVFGDDRTESEHERGCRCPVPSLGRRAAPQPSLAFSPRSRSEGPRQARTPGAPPGSLAHPPETVLEPAARKSHYSAPPRPP